MSYKYNPGFLSDADSIKNYSVRHRDFELLTQILIENAHASSNRHVLIVGPRGSGKTTLSRRLVAEINTNPKLGKDWYAIVLGEESYTITNAAEFWLECVFHLAQQTGSPAIETKYRELLAEHDTIKLRELALGVIVNYAAEIHKRIVLVAENLNVILEEQMDAHEGWLIRHSLQNVPELMLLATATSRFDQIQNIDKPLFEQFKIHDLRPLTLSEISTLWKRAAHEKLIQHKARPIQILTGGSPRLITILAEFSIDHSFRNLMTRVTILIDQYTDYFKSQLDALGPPERKVFVTLLDLWDPATTREISENSRIPVNTVSSYLNRLRARGAVTKRSTEGVQYWQAAERLFNLYYLMRRRGAPSNRVHAFVKFMTVYYEGDQLFEQATDIAKEVCTLEPNLRSDHYTALSQILDRFDARGRATLLTLAPPEFEKQLAAAQRDESAPLGTREGAKKLDPTERRIVDLVKSNDVVGATALLEQSKLRSKEDASLWGFVALSNALKTRNYEVSTQLIEVALTLNASSAHVNHLHGMILSAKSQAHEAAIAFKKAIDLGMTSSEEFVFLGNAYSAAFEYEKAEDAYKTAIAKDERNAEAWFKLAGVLNVNGAHLNDAEDALRRAASIEKTNSRYLGNLGTFLLQVRGDSRAAEKIFADMLKENPKSSRTWAYLIEAKIASNAPRNEIDAAFQNALKAELDHRWRVDGSYARFLDSVHAHEAAEQLLVNTTRDYPQAADAWFSLARHYAGAKGKENETVDSFEKALNLDADNAQIWGAFGAYLSQRSERHADAEKALTKAVEVAPRDCSGWRALGDHLISVGKIDEAKRSFEHAIELNSLCECSISGLSKALSAQRDGFSQISKLISEFVTKIPTSPNPHITFARYLLTLNGDKSASRKELLVALGKGANPRRLIEPYFDTLDLSQPTAAVAALQEFLELIPGEAQPLNLVAWEVYSRGAANGELGQFAIRLASEEVRRSPHEWAYRHTLASILTSCDENARATSEIEWLANNLQPHYLGEFIKLCVVVARTAEASPLLDTLSASSSRAQFEPLIVALQIRKGSEPQVAQEVLEVAKDIRAQIDGDATG